jgi:hypothetical protein
MVDRTKLAQRYTSGPVTAAPVKEQNFDQPVVNIGGDPGNDIVLTGEGIEPFHAMLMILNGQYQLVCLAPGADILVDGSRMAGSAITVSEKQRISIGGHSLTVKHNGTPTSMHITVASSGGLIAPIPAGIAEDDGNAHILLNFQPPTAEVAVEQTASYSLEITNAGPIVANFSIFVEGIPEEWVQINPPSLNLNEGQRASVKIEITPPHACTSTAGKHPFHVTVSSPNYPHQQGVSEAELDILPYYEFLLGNLSPREQRIPWQKKQGVAALPITNQSNNDTNFDILAMDDENGCSFDFKLNDNLELHRQATVIVPAGETYTVPIEISPLKRILVALRAKQYHYTASVQVTGQASAPQVLSGSVTSTPLFGWWIVALLVLMVATGLFLLLQPRIKYFQTTAGKDIIELGDSTALEWGVSPFATRLTISGVDKDITGKTSHLTISPTASTTYELTAGNWLSGLLGMDRKKSQTVLVVPPAPKIGVFDVDQTAVKKGLPVTLRWSVTKGDKALLTIDGVVYELTADQFSGEKAVVLEKSAIVSLEATSESGSELRSYYIKVVPPKITVKKYTVWVRPAAATTTGGISALLNNTVSVTNNREVDWLASLMMPRSGQPTALAAATTPTPTVTATATATSTATTADESFNQKYVELIPDETADNGYRVNFLQPSRELDPGEQVMLEWDVDGVDNVTIAPFTETLPQKGKQPYFPQESMNFTMTAKSGDLQELFMLPVTVFDGEPPVAPSIQIFQAAPTKATGSADVTFTWVISGTYTRIQLTKAEDIVGDWLPASGSKKVSVEETSSFILTAWNGTLSAAKAVDITIDPDLLEPTLTISDVYPHAGYFRVGDSVNVYINLTSPDATVASPTGSVVVTDNFSTCMITLPTKYCTLTFTTPGEKKIYAQYSGDDVYKSVDSAIYTNQSIIVEANKVQLTPSFYKLDMNSTGITKGAAINIKTEDLRVGQGLYIVVSVTALNATLDTADTKGTVTVRYCPLDKNNVIDQTNCTTSGMATVKVTEDAATMSTVGTANLVIHNFYKTGKYVLLFSYAHLNSAYEPVLMSTYLDGSYISAKVDPGDLILVPQGIPGVTCNYTECTLYKENPGTIVFDAKLMITEDTTDVSKSTMINLDSKSYSKPGDMTITYAPMVSPNTTTDWSKSCYWTTTSNFMYQYVCKGKDINLSEAFYFTYALPSSETNYAIIERHIPINVSVRTATTIVMTKNLLSTMYVGQKVDLLGGNMYVRDNIENSTIAGAEIIFKTDDADTSRLGEIAVLLDPTHAACTWDDADTYLTLKISSNLTATPLSDQHCYVYFKKAGTFNLQANYTGDATYDTTELLLKNTLVSKQTGIRVTWSAVNPSWYLYTDYTMSLTIACTGTTCTNFAPEALKDTVLLLNQNPASTCSITKDSVTLAGSLINLPAPSGSDNLQHVDLVFHCTTKTTVAMSLAFYSPDSDNFAISTSTGNGTNSVTVIALAKTMEGVLNRLNSTTNKYSMVGQTVSPVTNVSYLWVQDTYQVVVKVTDLPEEAVPISGADYILMTVPSDLVNYVDLTASTCGINPGSSNTFKISLSQMSGMSGFWWQASCTLFFTSTGDITQSPRNMTFRLNSSRVTAPSVSFSLPAAVTYKTVSLQASLNKLNASTNEYGMVGQTVTPATNVPNLWVKDTYQVMVKIPNIPDQAAPISGTDYIIMTMPQDLVDDLETTSTCSRMVGTENSFQMGLEQMSGKDGYWWQASCLLIFKSAATISDTSPVMNFSLASSRMSATDVHFGLPGTVSLKPVTLEGTLNWYDNSTVTPVGDTAKSIDVAHLWVKDTYQVVVKVPNIPEQVAPITGTDYVVVTLPQDLVKDVSSTTCTPMTGTENSYQLGLEKMSGALGYWWQASCTFVFSSVTTITDTIPVMSFRLVSTRMVAADVSFGLPAAVSLKPVTLNGYLNRYVTSTSTYTVVGDSAASKDVDNLWVEETYQVLAKIPDAPDGATPTVGSDYIVMSMPASLISLVDTTTSTCTKFGADTYKISLELASDSGGKWWQAACNLVFKSSGSITESSPKMNFALVSTRLGADDADFGLPSAVTLRSVTLQGYLNLYDPANSSYTLVGQTVTPVTNVDTLLVLETYQVQATIQDIPESKAPNSGTDYLRLTLPASMVNYVDTTNSTCTRDTSTTSSFKVAFSRVSDDWQASCNLIFKTTGSITEATANRKMSFDLVSNRFSATQAKFGLPTSVSYKNVAMTTQVNTGGVSGTVDGAAGSITSLGAATRGSVEQLIIGDTYTIVATLPSMRSDYIPGTDDVFVFTWPKSLDSHLLSTGTTCKYVTTSGSISYYSFPATKAGTVWSGSCNFTFKDGVTLLSSDAIVVSFDNNRFTTYPNVPLDLPDKVGSLTYNLSYDIMEYQSTIANQASVLSSLPTSGFNVYEQYLMKFTLTNVRADLSPAATDYMQVTWPGVLDTVLVSDSTKTTCTLANSQTPGVYKLSFTKDTSNNWTASCLFMFKSQMAIPTSASKTISANLVSTNITSAPANPTIVTLPQAAVVKETVTITPTWVGGLSASSTDGDFYARSNPTIKVVLADNHYQQSVTADAATVGITVVVNGSNRTCTWDSSGQFFTCTLDDDSIYSAKTVTITYPGNTYFASTSNSAKAVTITKIPVTFNIANLVWEETTTSDRPFPQIMQCQTCDNGSAGQAWYYALTDKTYTLKIPVTIDPSAISTANQALLSSSVVDQGTTAFAYSGYTPDLTLSQKFSSSVSGSVAGGVGTMSLALGSSVRGGVINWYKINYSGATVFADKTNTAVTDKAKFIHLREGVGFTYVKFEASGDKGGFTYTMSAHDDVCYNVYIELGDSSPTCENDQACWIAGDPPSENLPTITYAENAGLFLIQWMNFFGNPVLYNYNDTPSAVYNNPHPNSMGVKCTSDGYDSGADDWDIKVGIHEWDPTLTASKFQTWLINSNYLGMWAQGMTLP